ncbi:MAG: hypothetical protein NZ853_10785 [Leptospiraceae bacterium]|nr:hypothetical protein [Leptospiraceae bacterium]MDW7977061.1 hypothetical protein [Leptospiraceae bacterium]
MKLIKGNLDSPSGNLIAFSEVKGYNPIDPKAKILAVHIVVSPLSAHSYNYPVVVFPVSTFPDKELFFQTIEFIENCDVIQLEDFRMPEDEDEDEYLKKRMKMLNSVVQEYVDAYQKKYAKQFQEQDIAIFDFLFDLEQISLNKKRVHQKVNQKRKKSNPERNLNLEISLKTLEELINQKEKNKRGRPSKKQKVISKEEIEKYQPYITFIKNYHPEIDIINFEKAIEDQNLQLANLYLQKYYAILEERYETAQYFQNRIKELEKK